MAFDPVSVSHTDTVRATRSFLHELLDAETLLDVTDVSKTGHKNPAQWYQEATEQAKYVAVVVPPKVAEGTERGSPYQGTYSLCLDLVSKRWKDSLETSSKGKDDCFVVLLPESDSTLVPKECRHWPKFQIPKQSLSLRQHLQLADKDKKGIRFPVPEVMLPKIIEVNERYEENLRLVTAKKMYPGSTYTCVVECEAAKAAEDAEGEHQQSKPDDQTRQQADFSVRDVKLIDESSEEDEDEACQTSNEDESSELNPEADLKWKLY